MKVTKIAVTYGGKINLGEYSNVDVSVTVEAEVKPTETDREALADVRGRVMYAFASMVREVVENQVNAAMLIGKDAEAIRRRLRRVPGFTYLEQINPKAASALLAYLVEEIESAREPDDAVEAGPIQRITLGDEEFYEDDEVSIDDEDDFDEDDFDDDDYADGTDAFDDDEPEELIGADGPDFEGAPEDQSDTIPF